MHEFAIARSVLAAVRAEAELRPGTRVSKIGLRIGDLAGLDADALSFCFEALTKGTDFGSVTLEIERKPRRQGCSRCSKEFVVVNYETSCPACGRRRPFFSAEMNSNSPILRWRSYDADSPRTEGLARE